MFTCEAALPGARSVGICISVSVLIVFLQVMPYVAVVNPYSPQYPQFYAGAPVAYTWPGYSPAPVLHPLQPCFQLAGSCKCMHTNKQHTLYHNFCSLTLSGP